MYLAVNFKDGCKYGPSYILLSIVTSFIIVMSRLGAPLVICLTVNGCVEALEEEWEVRIWNDQENQIDRTGILGVILNNVT